jgi:cytochrome c oxidase assembly factor 5
MVDMRKRFRGNQPVKIQKETDPNTGQTVEVRQPVPQLYAGKSVFQSSVKGAGGEKFPDMDPEKTRGL